MADFLNDPRYAEFIKGAPDLGQIISGLAGQATGLPEGATIPGSLASVGNKQASLEAAPQMAILKAALESDLGQGKHQNALQMLQAREAMKLQTHSEIGKLMDAAMPLVSASVTMTPEIQRITAMLRSPQLKGEAVAQGIEAMVKQNLERATQAEVDKIKDQLKGTPHEVTPDVEASIADKIRVRLEKGMDTESVGAEHRATAERLAAEKADREGVKKAFTDAKVFKAPKMTPEQMVEHVYKLPPAERENAIARFAGEERAATGKRRGLMGLLGGAGVALLMSKVLGGGSDAATSALPPEAMMAMMKAAGRGNGEEENSDVGTGRSLLNMQRSLGLIKMMQQMAGANSAAVTPAQLV